MKMNHTLKREQIAKDLVAFYEASGVEFTCAAVFERVVLARARKWAAEAVNEGYVFSKSKYWPTEGTAGIFVTAALRAYREKLYCVSRV